MLAFFSTFDETNNYLSIFYKEFVEAEILKWRIIARYELILIYDRQSFLGPGIL